MRRDILSICIPTYNRAPLLRECLQSIIVSCAGYEQQVEIVISDNASTDDTAAVVKGFQDRNSNIHYHCNVAIEGNANIVRVAQLGRGEYIWVFGDDDKVDKRAVPTVLERISRGCNLIVLNFSCHSSDFSRQSRSSYYSVRLPLRFNNHDLLLKTFGTTLGLISAIVMHRSIVQGRVDDRLQAGIDYRFPFLPAIYADMTKKCNAEFVPDSLVLNRTGNPVCDNATWIQTFCKNMALLIEAQRTLGYSSASILTAKNRTIRRYIFGWIIYQKMEGSAWRDIYEELWKYYRDCLAFWLLCLPLVLLPGSLLRMIRKARRRFRCLRINLS